MKNNIKLIIGIIIGIIISGSIVYAYDLFANSVGYDNTTSGLKDANNQDVDNVQDAIDVLYSRANNGGGGSSTSELINNFSITNSELTGVTTNISINGTITTTDSSAIRGYMIIVNNEIINVTSTLPYNLKLEPGTENTIKVRAIDKDGNTKESTNSVSVTTPNVISTPLEYPIITTKGVVNAKFVNPSDSSDFTYGLDLSLDCTASDALDKKAYDNDETTYADITSGKVKFYFADDFDLYYVAFKIGGTSGYLFYAADGYSGNINTSRESTIYNGYYHTTYYGKNSQKWLGYKAAIGNNTYEIKYDITIP